MARIILLDAQSSVQMKINDQVVKLCACGLSKTFPICDGAHKITRDEEMGKLYEYLPDGTRREVTVQNQDKL